MLPINVTSCIAFFMLAYMLCLLGLLVQLLNKKVKRVWEKCGPCLKSIFLPIKEITFKLKSDVKIFFVPLLWKTETFWSDILMFIQFEEKIQSVYGNNLKLCKS